ncbi:MAG: glycosyltransferase family 4 protein [Candidatus Aenigmarchaeota archaeon]|nr:glycosyltransferase family 4 protein [Candidatus Aenigmarchaeota archaeon]
MSRSKTRSPGRRKRILMVAPSLSGSAYMIPYIYAKILMKKYDVKIIGAAFGKKMFIEDKRMDVENLEPHIRKPVQVGMINTVPINLARLMRNDFDIIHCFKLLPHTIPVCSIAKSILRKPLVLTIDDFDKASPENPVKRGILEMSEKFYRSADAVTVPSEGLRKIYGGTVIYPPIDIDAQMPKKSSAEKLRKRLGLQGKIVVTYIGTLYKTKGIDVLIEAVKRTGRDDIRLVLFEFGKETETYKKMSGPETIWVKKRTGEKSLDYTMMSDIYAIPTRDTRYTRVQTPAKIFEAMSMGRAIVASDISEIPKILDYGRAGVLTKPGDVESLKDAILRLAGDRKTRLKLGARAKRIYKERCHYRKQGEKLLKVYRDLERKIGRGKR